MIILDGSTFKPVMQAFFVSAIKVWNDLISGKDIWKVKIEEKEEEEKKDSQNNQSNIDESEKSSIFESKSRFIYLNYQFLNSIFRIIKPLLVAKEKIFDYFKVIIFTIVLKI